MDTNSQSKPSFTRLPLHPILFPRLRDWGELQDRHHGVDDFLDADCFHAAEINWAFAQEARAAFDMMSQNYVAIAERPSEPGLGRTKDRDC